MISSPELQLDDHRRCLRRRRRARPASATSGIPATCCALLLWGVGHRRARDLHLGGDGVEQRASPPTSAAPRRACPDSLRELVLARRPGRRRSRCRLLVLLVLVAQQRWRRLGLARARAARRAPPRSRCSTWCSISTRASPARCTTAPGSRRRGFPSLAYVGRCRRRDDRGQALVAAPMAAGRRHRRCSCSSLAMALAGSAGVPELVLALAAGATRRRRRCSSRSARRTGARRRPRSHRARAGRSRPRGPDARPRRGRPRPALPRRHRRRRQLREGVRPGQPRRRPPVPRLPRAAVARPERRLPVVVARTRRRARGLDAAAWPAQPASDARRRGAHRARATARWCSPWSTSTDVCSTSSTPSEIDAELLDAIWHEVAVLHRARFAHRSLRAGNVMVADGRPRLIDLGLRQGVRDAAAAGDRPRRAPGVAGHDRRASNRVVASAARVLAPRRPRGGRAVPPASRAVGRDAQAARRSRCSASCAHQIADGHRRRAAAAGAPRSASGRAR